MKPKFCELIDEQSWREAWRVLQTLRPDISLNDLLAKRESLLSQGYRLFGIRDGEELISGQDGG